MTTADRQESQTGPKPPFDVLLADLGRVSAQIGQTDTDEGVAVATLEGIKDQRTRLGGDRSALVLSALGDVQDRTASGALDGPSAFAELKRIHQQTGDKQLERAITRGEELYGLLVVGQPVMTPNKVEIRKIAEPPEGEAALVPHVDRMPGAISLKFWTWLEDPKSGKPQRALVDDSSYLGSDKIEATLDRDVEEHADYYNQDRSDDFRFATRVAELYRAIGNEEKAKSQETVAVRNAAGIIQHELTSIWTHPDKVMAWLMDHSAETLWSLRDEQSKNYAIHGKDKDARIIQFAENFARAKTPNWEELTQGEINALFETSLKEMNERGIELLNAQQSAEEATIRRPQSSSFLDK